MARKGTKRKEKEGKKKGVGKEEGEITKKKEEKNEKKFLAVRSGQVEL